MEATVSPCSFTRELPISKVCNPVSHYIGPIPLIFAEKLASYEIKAKLTNAYKVSK